MLLFLLFLGWLVVSPVVHYFLRQHPFSLFHWLAPVFRNCARDKVFMVVLVGSVALHLIGTRILGQVSYNTTGFDVITHTLFGFIVREGMLRANEVHSFTTQIGGRLPKPIGGMVTVTTLALAFCLAHEVQEQIQTLIPGLSAGVWYTWKDQVKDMVMNTVGITISLHKEDKRLVTSAVSFVLVIGLYSFFFFRG